ncbi:MAG: hypothetical protein ACJAS4_001545 [Bacteriovoracaceae bacterium]|jgi:hypothetical protein
MRKLLEIEFNDEIRKVNLIVWIFSFLTFALFLLTRVAEKAIFNIGFFIELTFIFVVLRFYGRALRNRNYAFWGLTLVLSLYLFMNILQYTFMDYNIFILYVAFLSSLFLGINGYILSSPLYFPRIQWWEYDFRYRGELKATAILNDEESEIRVADVRRESMSLLSFSQIRLGQEIKIDIPFGEKVFEVTGKLKTAREDIPGRPIRYGVKLDVEKDTERKNYLELRKVWNMKKNANFRRKFADYKESKEAKNEFQSN